MPLSLKNLDIFPPADPSQFDGRRLLECYRPIELLELTPADFKAAYDFICLYRASFEMHMSENVNGHHEVTLNEAKAKNIGVTLARLTKCFPGEWYVDGDSKTLAIPLKLAPRLDTQNYEFTTGPWSGEVFEGGSVIIDVPYEALPEGIQDAIVQYAKQQYGQNVFDNFPIDLNTVAEDWETQWSMIPTKEPATIKPFSQRSR